MKAHAFQVLLALTEGERHGWALVRELQARDPGSRILPSNFYRVLRGLLADGLIEEAGTSNRRTYFKLTKAGRAAARYEARRLEALVAESRSRKLLTSRGR